jgi:hypothetical protein
MNVYSNSCVKSSQQTLAKNFYETEFSVSVKSLKIAISVILQVMSLIQIRRLADDCEYTSREAVHKKSYFVREFGQVLLVTSQFATIQNAVMLQSLIIFYGAKF